jgi:hypothetical protein
MSDPEKGDNSSESDADATANIPFSQINWLTDIDDYDPPLSPSAPSVCVSPLPPTTLPLPAMSIHIHTSPLPPAVPIAPIILMSLPCAPTLLSDDVVTTLVFGTCVKHMHNYSTHSQGSHKVHSNSSQAVSISIILDPSYAPIPKSNAELRTMVHRLQMENCLTKKEIIKARAETKASNAHCTIMTCAASVSKTELENQKHRTRQSVKASAHLISHLMLIKQHDAEI